MTKVTFIKKTLGITLFLSVLLTGCTPSQLSEVDADTYVEKLYANSEYWGLGKKIEEYVSNNRDYEWYVDQYHTGAYWDMNCGPAAIEMVGRYYNPNFSYTASDARDLYFNDGGGWFDYNISGSLRRFGIEYEEVRIRNAKTITTELDKGNILLINPTMALVAPETETHHHVGLYYLPAEGHYLIAKGYIIVDGEIYFEIYDPWGLDWQYADGTLKGKDRYYDATSLMNALQQWFLKAYAIDKIENVNA